MIARVRVLATLLAVASASAPLALAEIGFLGPRGTFSEQAADAYRASHPEVGDTVPLESMEAVVDALREGRISRGILPVASTVAGFPAASTRLFLSAPDPGFRIVDELVVPIELHLVVKPGTGRDRISAILSHPNALGEAGAALDSRYRGIPREETVSTAAAAERVAQGDGTLAAVASRAAARLYGLEVLDATIQDDPHNATSFWVLARPEEASIPERAMKLALLIESPVGSARFSDAVARLRGEGFWVVFVNSVPLPGELYGYRFLVSLAADTPAPVTGALRLPGTRLLGAFD